VQLLNYTKGMTNSYKCYDPCTPEQKENSKCAVHNCNFGCILRCWSFCCFFCYN